MGGIINMPIPVPKKSIPSFDMRGKKFSGGGSGLPGPSFSIIYCNKHKTAINKSPPVAPGANGASADSPSSSGLGKSICRNWVWTILNTSALPFLINLEITTCGSRSSTIIFMISIGVLTSILRIKSIARDSPSGSFEFRAACREPGRRRSGAGL